MKTVNGQLNITSTMKKPIVKLSKPQRPSHVVAFNYSFPELESFVCDFSGKGEDEWENFPHSSAASSSNGSFRSETTPAMYTSTESSPTRIPPNPEDTMSYDQHIGSPQSVAFQNDSNKVLLLQDVKMTKRAELGESIAKQRSRRLKKPKKIARQKNRVRYNMNLVPNIQRNKNFLLRWRQKISTGIVSSVASHSSLSSLPSLVICDYTNSPESKFKRVIVENSADSSCRDSLSNCLIRNCDSYDSKSKDSEGHIISSKSPPFIGNESVIWVPDSRSEWEDCIDELTAVCTAAAWRRHQETKSTKEFYPPLSRIYIRDRIDIDDPLRGFQIRHKTGGWLQGFIMTTTFTIWTHYFKWDSNHPQNGLSSNEHEIGLVDDGSLSTELEKQARSGDPLTGGVVWPNVAEIGLVGALGGGEYLVQMALDDITKRGTYDYVVLQATDTSRPFYEKFGFIRVGAVSKYGSEQEVVGHATAEVVGYRHWTYANETSQRLDQHGAPSCMMALRINDSRKQTEIGETQPFNITEHSTVHKSILDEVSQYFVSEKPKIQPLGLLGRKRSVSDISGPGTATKLSPVKGRKPRKTNSAPGLKRTYDTKIGHQIDSSLPCHRNKRLKANATFSITNDKEHFKELSSSMHRSVSNGFEIPTAKPELRKQKIINMYRDPKKIYYYNKVVTPKITEGDTYQYKSKYYFVLNYEEDIKMIRLIPLYHKGTFKGKREGRRKWKATVLPRIVENQNDKNYFRSMDIINAPCSKWEIVSAFMVTKCASVAEESWDILG